MKKTTFLTAFITIAAALTATATSPLATGRWAKVSVDTTGVFEISHQALKEMGFAEPTKVSVYGSGGVEAADHSFTGTYGEGFHATASMHTADGRLLFFGEGPVRLEPTSATAATINRNFYDTKAYYYLTDKDGYREPALDTTADDGNNAFWHRDVQFFDRDIYSPTNGGAIFLSHNLNRGAVDTYPFTVADYYDGSGDTGYFYMRYGVNSDWADCRADVTFSDGITTQAVQIPLVTRRSSSSNDIYKAGTATGKFTVSDLCNTATMTVRQDDASDSDDFAVDYIYILYPRVNNLDNAPQLVMNFDNMPTSVAVINAPENTVMWNVTPGVDAAGRRMSHTRLDVSYDPMLQIASAGCADGTRRVVAFDPSATQRAVGSIEPVEYVDLTPDSLPDIIIFTTDAMLAHAGELADIHRQYQNANVVVATQNRIFDQYSEGSRTPMALRRYAKPFYDADPERKFYIIMYGSGSYDNKHLANEGPYLITYQTENEDNTRTKAFNSCFDLYFGMLRSTYSNENIYRTLADRAVGRIAVNTPDAARAYNDKVRTFFERGPEPMAYTRALMYSDTGDSFKHIEQNNNACNELAKNSLMSIARVDNYFYPYDDKEATYPDLKRDASLYLGRGVGMMAYSGHGGPAGLSTVLNKITVNENTYDIPPLCVFASCETFGFDRDGYSLSRHMLERGNGGAIGVIAAGRSVILNWNAMLEQDVASVYATLKPGACYGDIWLDGRNKVLYRGSATCDYNAMSYNYGGDPALPVPVPQYGIVLDAQGDRVFTPRVSKTISGYISNGSGGVLDDFDGTVEIDLHKGAVVKQYYPNETTTKEVTDEHELLTLVKVPVTAGRFTASLTVPQTGVASSKNRISMAAVSTDGRIAAGVNRTYSVNDSEPDPALVDTTPPVVMQAYIDTDDFVPGNTVGSSFRYYALVDPSTSGLRTVAGLERGVKLTLDNDNRPTAGAMAKMNADGTVIFDIPFEDVSIGKHTIELVVANNAGLTATHRTDFVVGTGNLTATLSHNTDGAVRDDMTFDIADIGDATARLLVLDRRGRTVLSIPSCTFPYTWNLTDASGQRVPDGHYRAWAVLEREGAHGSTEAVHFRILRPRKDNNMIY